MEIEVSDAIEFFVSKTENGSYEVLVICQLFLLDLYRMKWTGKQGTRMTWYYGLPPVAPLLQEEWKKLDKKRVIRENGEKKPVFLKPGPQIRKKGREYKFPREVELTMENISVEFGDENKHSEINALTYIGNTAPFCRIREEYKHEWIGKKLNMMAEREKLLEELN